MTHLDLLLNTRSLLRLPNYYNKNSLSFSPSVRMSGKSVSEDKKIKKSNIYKNKKILKIDHIDSNKVLVSKEEPYDKKRFIQIFNWIR